MTSKFCACKEIAQLRQCLLQQPQGFTLPRATFIKVHRYMSFMFLPFLPVEHNVLFHIVQPCFSLFHSASYASLLLRGFAPPFCEKSLLAALPALPTLPACFGHFSYFTSTQTAALSSPPRCRQCPCGQALEASSEVSW